MNILYVQAGSPDATDTAMQGLLTGRSDTFTTINESTAVPDLTSYDLVILGSSATAVNLGTKYRDVAKPVVSFRSGHWTTPLELTTAATGNGTATAVTVLAAGAAHAIGTIAGLVEGANTIASSNIAINRATSSGIAAAAVQMAWQFATSNICLFAYESGDTMANATVAAARRVAFGLAGASLNTLGQDTFFAAIDWAGGLTADPPTADFTASVALKTVTVTDASVAGTNPITSVTYDWGDSSGTDVNGPTHTYATGGAYTITQTVDDGVTTPDTATADIITLSSVGDYEVVTKRAGYADATATVAGLRYDA